MEDTIRIIVCFEAAHAHASSKNLPRQRFVEDVADFWFRFRWAALPLREKVLPRLDVEVLVNRTQVRREGGRPPKAHGMGFPQQAEGQAEGMLPTSLGATSVVSPPFWQ